ncbi:unnamed protein product, partial [Rotaria magnacalcarata]
MIGSSGAQHLADALFSNTTLIKLILRNNVIDDVGLRHFLDVLTVNKNLRTLDLSGNGYDDNLLVETKARIRGKTVDCTTIDLRCCRLDDEAMELLCQALVNNKSITTLELRSNQIGETGAQQLARGLHESTINTLLLGHNRLGDKGLKHLAGFLASSITLEVLDLSDNDIGEIGMRLLPSLSYKG